MQKLGKDVKKFFGTELADRALTEHYLLRRGSATVLTVTDADLLN